MMRKTILAVVIASAVVAAASAVADPALTFILQSLATEEQQPRKQANLILRRADTETHYVIERILPDRLHLTSRRGDTEQELYLIGNRMYQRTATGWVESPALAMVSTPLSVIGLFEDRLENVKELDPVTRDGVEQRVFEGTISWFAGRSTNEGQIRIFIETASALPRLMTFQGRCGLNACAFEHAINYDPGIEIEAPIP